ncbi:Major facilitator superfamily domain containing protein [Rhypophila sp. PSN 637]
MTPLLVSTFMAAIESTIVVSALPCIVKQLDAGSAYVWFVNAYLLCKTAFIPLWGQLAGVAGRRWPIMAAVALFVLGSGIAGGANTSTTMIAGRAVQGLGGGGMTIIGQLIISDLVSPREVPKYVGYLFGALGLGTAIGPFLGGLIVQRTSWRWVFYLNLPIGGLTLIMQYLLLRHLSYSRTFTFAQKLKRIDLLGNFFIIASTSLTLIALSWGGATYPWTSAPVLCLLIVGILGLILSMFYEAYSPWVVEPTIHTAIFRNYSTDINLFLAFMQFMFAIWTSYFLPVYFQGVLLQSAEMAGVILLPTVIIPLGLAILVGRGITRWGRYKVFHVVGFGLMVLGYGLFTMFDDGTSIAVVVVVQCVWSLGLGQLMTSTLPGVQASVDEKLRGPATSTWGFFREFGGVWGTAIPGAIFNSRFGTLVEREVTDTGLRDELSGGNGYSFASAELILALSVERRRQVIRVFTESLRLVFQVGIGLSGLCFLLSILQKEYELRKTHQSEYGLKRKAERPSSK